MHDFVVLELVASTVGFSSLLAVIYHFTLHFTISLLNLALNVLFVALVVLPCMSLFGNDPPVR